MVRWRGKRKGKKVVLEPTRPKKKKAGIREKLHPRRKKEKGRKITINASPFLTL